MRYLPHRPAPARRRGLDRRAAARPRPPDHRDRRSASGRRVGVPWLGWTCGECRYCLSAAREPVPPRALHRPRHRWRHGASSPVADERFCFPIPDGFPDDQAAPLLCAGLIGYRSLRMCGDARRLGLYGFGAAAHILCQVARCAGSRGVRVHATRRRARAGVRPRARRELGRRLGRACRLKRSTRRSSSRPTVRSCRSALRALAPGRHRRLRRDPHERDPGVRLRPPVARAELRSVANLTRRDGAGVPGAGAAGPRSHPCHELSARAGERGARRPSPRPLHRRRRADARVTSQICTRRRPRKLPSRCSR